MASDQSAKRSGLNARRAPHALRPAGPSSQAFCVPANRLSGVTSYFVPDPAMLTHDGTGMVKTNGAQHTSANRAVSQGSCGVEVSTTATPLAVTSSSRRRQEGWCGPTPRRSGRSTSQAAKALPRVPFAGWPARNQNVNPVSACFLARSPSGPTKWCRIMPMFPTPESPLCSTSLRLVGITLRSAYTKSAPTSAQLRSFVPVPLILDHGDAGVPK